MRVQSTLLWGLVGTAAALTERSTHVLHEKRHAPVKKWVKREAVGAQGVLPMRIGLVQSNFDNGVGDNLLDELSHPDSPRYSQWYTAEEVNDLFAPAKESVDAVRAWIEDSGIAPHRISLSANKQWVQFDAFVHEAEELLKTKYHYYEHKATGNRHVACEEYHVPSHLTSHIDYVTPGIKLLGGGKASSGREENTEDAKDIEKRGFKTGNQKKFGGPVIGKVIKEALSLLNNTQTELQNCDQYMTPPCVMALYNITRGTKAHKGNELGIFEEGDFYAPEDLALFFVTFANYIPATTEPILHGIDGGFAPGVVATGESDLDFQLSYPLIYPQQSVLFQTDDIFYATGIEGKGGFLNTFLDAIDGSYCTHGGQNKIDPKYPDPIIAGYQGKLQCGVYKPTNVISISYGEQEDDLPTAYQQRQCKEFMKLGLQGTSVLIASGDSGVAARAADDGNSNGCLGKGEVFNPDFPASCPYITAAGSTFLPAGGNVHKDQEISTTRFPSGGGFSNIYKRPKYQDAAVQVYFANGVPDYKYYSTSGTNNPPESTTNGGIYNRAGRGYPDVSAVGDNIVIILDGTPQLIGGTSASSPAFASILNRINEERLSAGKKTVGFVNPTLYKHPEILHDITNGTNAGCNTTGFHASKGWDPVSGLGTPNYPAMLKLFMSLP